MLKNVANKQKKQDL